MKTKHPERFTRAAERAMREQHEIHTEVELQAAAKNAAIALADAVDGAIPNQTGFGPNPELLRIVQKRLDEYREAKERLGTHRCEEGK